MKKIKQFFIYIWNRLKNNWGLKILSFFFAIMLWNTVITNTNPVVTRTVPNLPVTVVGVPQLTERDLALTDSINSYIKTATVTLDITRNQLPNYDPSAISVTLDLGRLTSTGEYEIALIASTSEGVVQKISPASITVEVDKQVNRVIPVACDVVGKLSSNYHRGALTVTPNAIQISGPEELVQKVERSYLRLDITGEQNSISLSKDYTFIDKNGIAIDDTTPLTISTDSVVLDMPITPIKKLMVSPVLLGEDKIAEGYYISGIEIVPDMVDVTGTPELLEEMSSLLTEPINLTGHFDNVHIPELKILRPDGLNLLEVESAAILISIDERMSESKFEQVPIEIRNIPEGLSLEKFEELVDITVRAPENTIDNLAASHITLFVDMTGATKGESSRPIQYEAPEEYRVDSVAYSNDTVTVKLK